ncbi:hypothetical protein A1359_20995 [Methylomonas lenta]|uniref:Uncharacterized protein n=1 Tax=Methylomonas lenta TaxID=980561 RepID=A0A177NQR7_9GAMM|nr:hypothetical protein A1359_20995 [Methylomonas lenta]
MGQRQKVTAWIVANSQAAKSNRLDDYLVSVDDIERLTGQKIPLVDRAKHDKPAPFMGSSARV